MRFNYIGSRGMITISKQTKKGLPMKVKELTGWSTQDELNALDFMTGDEKRGHRGTIPTKREKKNRLACWMNHAESRRWPRSINVVECMTYATALYAKL